MGRDVTGREYGGILKRDLDWPALNSIKFEFLFR